MLRSFLPLVVAVGLIAGAYMTVLPPNAAAVSTSEAKVFARAAKAEKPFALPIPVSVSASTRAPVPLLVAKHETYFVNQPPAEEVQQPPSINADAPIQISESASPSDATAKAMIEGDGYRNVKALSKGSDGNWHGRAMRGSTEITVSVGATGDVSAE
jgi:hypothetical protein